MARVGEGPGDGQRETHTGLAGFSGRKQRVRLHSGPPNKVFIVKWA